MTFVPSFLLLTLWTAEPPAPRAADAPAGQDITWRSVGPGGGGWIQSMAWDPHAPNRLLVGCDVGGLYDSDDAGRSYARRNDGLHDYFLESIAVAPGGRVVLLGTESGLHRSEDGGRTWHWIRKGFPSVQRHAFSAPVGAVVFDPSEPRVALAGIGRPRWGKGGAGAIYRSTDSGRSWTLVSAGQLPTDAIISDLEFQPGSRQTILAATNRGVYRSDDGGGTWTASSEGIPHRHVEEVAFAAARPEVVYLSLRTTARDAERFNGGVFRSDDAGRTWQAANGPGMPSRVGKSQESPWMTSNIKELAVDPRDPNVIYAGDRAWVTAGVYKTLDGGRHWSRVTRARGADGNMDYGWIGQWGPSVECLALCSASPDRLAFGTSGHVFVSDDAGQTWQQRYCKAPEPGRFAGTGLEVTCNHRVLPDPVRRDRVYLCNADVGLLVSEDQGRTFRRSYRGMKHEGNCFSLIVDPQRPRTLWAGTGQWAYNAGDVCRSDDDGQSWEVVGKPASGLPDGQVRHLLLDLESPVESRRLVATSKGHGVFESRDGGRSWQSIGGDLPEAAREPAGLILLPGRSRMVLALAGRPDQGAGVYRTDNGGKNWQRVNEAPLFASLTCIAADAKVGVLYLGAREFYDRAAGRLYPGGLFRSADGGRRWQRVLDFHFVGDVAVDPSRPDTVYAATTDHPYHDDYPAAGLMRSTDGGKTWRRENTGLTHRNISCIAVDSHLPALLYVGTAGNGAFVGGWQ